MPQRMHRTQILLPEEEYRRLLELAHEEGRSLGSVVREAVAKYHSTSSRERRLAAVRRMAEMRLPVADWPQLEEDIIQGHLLDEP
jgi:predicted DNA-binding protein